MADQISPATAPSGGNPTAEPLPGKDGKNPGSSSKPAGRVWLLATLTLAALIVGGYFLHQSFLYEATDDAQIDGHIMPLSARINGQVSEVRFVQGQLVHQGDVLVVIDDHDYHDGRWPITCSSTRRYGNRSKPRLERPYYFGKRDERAGFCHRWCHERPSCGCICL